MVVKEERFEKKVSDTAAADAETNVKNPTVVDDTPENIRKAREDQQAHIDRQAAGRESLSAGSKKSEKK